MYESEQKKSKEGLSTEVLYKIEVAANRYDLLCVEGLALALKSFLKKSKFPKFKILNSNPDHIEQLIVEETVSKVRPVGMSAILRNIKFTDDSIKGFMDLQDKLHNNICRGRTLVSVGTHDLDTVKGPFYYRALKPEQIKFVPLSRKEEVDGNGLMRMLKDDPKLGKYLYMIEKEELFPAFVDSEGVIMSVPPIINSEHTRIKETTKNVFLDITATDYTKANIVLNTLIAMFSCYCEQPFTVEQVNVVDAVTGKVTPFPNLEPGVFKADINYLKSISGVPKDLNAEEICGLLEKMELESKKLSDTEIEVYAPITRSDILHACDIAEDLAIAYGYNNIEIKEVQTLCHGKQQQINKLTDIFRREMATGGYVEFLTMSLLSRKEMFSNMLRGEEEEKTAVKIGYAKTKELDFVRTSLVPGLLKSIEANKANQLPYKIFEISDCCQIDDSNEVGAINRRKLCFAYCNTFSGFEILQGMVDKLMKKIGLEFNVADKTKTYTIKRSEYPQYFEDRQADLLILDGINIGSFGIVHPKILKNFGIKNPVSICEIDIQKVFDLIINGTLIGGFY